MMPQRSCLLSACCLMLLQLGLAIRIQELSRDRTAPTTANTLPYRVSRPAPKQPAQRVPAHLQDIRPGFVDDDAGDVIRIIEPPQHFQQLKRMRQRQAHAPAPVPQHAQKAIVWEQPRKLSSNRATKQKVSHKTPSSGDLLTQETQLSPHSLNNLQLPVEILASVRKTERLLKRQRPKLPLVRQRHVQRQTHTLITQKSLEKERNQRGQQQRLRATLKQEQEYKRSKRVKRATAATTAAATHYDVENGLKLVAHIGELLKNATKYLPDELTEQQPIASKLQRSCDDYAASCDKRQRRRQRQRLIRQQAVEKKTAAVRRRNFRFESATTTNTTAAAAATTPTTSTISTTAATTSATPLASRLINSRKSNNHNQLRLQQVKPSSRSSNDDSVLYADIMSNIRNLWQDQEPQFAANSTADIGALNVYLNQLDEIAKKLPTALPITGLEHQDLSMETATPTHTPPPSYYLFNNDRTDELLLPLPDMPEGNETVASLALEVE